MGSWCGTCAISHLPINAGDKIRLFFMTMQNYDHEKEGAGFCSTSDIWYPRGLPISGEYDDYGGIENITEDINSKILVDGLKNDFVSYKAKHQWEHDVNPSDLTISILVEETERDRAMVYDGRSKIESDRMNALFANPESFKDGSVQENIDATHEEDRPIRPFGFIMVHEDVYQAMLKFDPIDAHHDNNGYLYKKRSEILAIDMREFYHDGLETAKELEGLNLKVKRLLLSTTKNNWNSFAHNAINSDPPFCKGISYYWDFLRNKMNEGVPYEDPEVQAVAQGLIDFTKFSWAMSAARRAWMPQTGKGSQQNETDIHKIIANSTLKIARKYDTEMKEYNTENKGWQKKHNKKELAKRVKLEKDENAKKGK